MSRIVHRTSANHRAHRIPTLNAPPNTNITTSRRGKVYLRLSIYWRHECAIYRHVLDRTVKVPFSSFSWIIHILMRGSLLLAKVRANRSNKAFEWDLDISV